MTTREIELKALMLASLDGDAASHRALLNQLSHQLRAYYKGKLTRFGRGRRKIWFRRRYWRSTSSDIPMIPSSP